MAGPKPFSVIFERGATKELEAFDPTTARTIVLEIQQRLAAEPFREIKTRIKRLTGFAPPLYRLCVGDYRVYYGIREQHVVILAVLDKKDSERWLKRISYRLVSWKPRGEDRGRASRRYCGPPPAEARRAVRCPMDSQCLLVDYKDSTGSPNARDHLYGHAAYTRLNTLLFNTTEIIGRLYAT